MISETGLGFERLEGTMSITLQKPQIQLHVWGLSYSMYIMIVFFFNLNSNVISEYG